MAHRLRVWMVINPPNDPEYFYVTNPQEAMKVIERKTKDNMISPVYEDAFGLEEQTEPNGEWYEWYDENGEDILSLMDDDNGEKNG